MRKKKNVFEHIGSLINDPLGLKAEAERKKRIAERRKHQFGRLKKDEKKKMEGNNGIDKHVGFSNDTLWLVRSLSIIL